MSFFSVSSCRNAAIAGVVACAGGAVSAQQLTFESPGADGDLAQELREASLLIAAQG
ncbi:hypothetical protein LCGC14_3104090, partial [marine sediment metagenome]